MGKLAIAIAAAVSISQLPYASAQFPKKPEDVTILNSKFNDGVYISYKEVLRHRARLELHSISNSLKLIARHL